MIDKNNNYFIIAHTFECDKIFLAEMPPKMSSAQNYLPNIVGAHMRLENFITLNCMCYNNIIIIIIIDDFLLIDFN